MTVSLYGQDKYGSEPDKCKTNLSLFHEAVKMGNYEAAMEPWKWCLENCPEASKIIYSDGIKMTEAIYDKNAGEGHSTGDLLAFLSNSSSSSLSSFGETFAVP